MYPIIVVCADELQLSPETCNGIIEFANLGCEPFDLMFKWEVMDRGSYLDDSDYFFAWERELNDSLLNHGFHEYDIVLIDMWH